MLLSFFCEATLRIIPTRYFGPRQRPVFLPFGIILSNSSTSLELTIPQNHRSTWSLATPPPVNHSPPSQSNLQLQDLQNTLVIPPNTQKPPNKVFANPSDTTQQTTPTNSS